MHSGKVPRWSHRAGLILSCLAAVCAALTLASVLRPSPDQRAQSGAKRLTAAFREGREAVLADPAGRARRASHNCHDNVSISAPDSRGSI
jgi:hypothetical protein